MNSNQDGGYYAIKGFLYQFDATIFTILENPKIAVNFENIQDINYLDYVIQVKHKETQKFSFSKIKNPTLQLISLYKKDKTKKYRLFAYFKDKVESEWHPNVQEIKKILGKESENYPDEFIQEFASRFVMKFTNDYETQFYKLIEKIKAYFCLQTIDLAILYHSIFSTKIQQHSLNALENRKLSAADLKEFLNDSEKNIFYNAYSKYLTEDKYNKLVVKEYFTFKQANIDNFERLLIIDCCNYENITDITKLAHRICKKYFRLNKSPQPYLCFLNISNQDLNEIKIDLYDKDIEFNDGTNFNGDRFRIDKLIENQISNEQIKFKIVGVDNLDKVFSQVRFSEVFQFYIDRRVELSTKAKHIVVQVAKFEQILKIIK